MATCEEIKRAAKIVYPSSLHPGCFDITPPVRVTAKSSDITAGAYMINLANGNICVIQKSGCGYWVDPECFEISDDQSRPTEIPKETWEELEKLLNRLADEREQDDDGPGGMPTHNAKLARDMLDKLWMKRRKPAHIR